ncbi:MAG: hypothetical protein MZW92_50075 [Comamonadaceae bacterium]|nr:hypothetical protein [Comamonadaceae bacterium]
MLDTLVYLKHETDVLARDHHAADPRPATTPTPRSTRCRSWIARELGPDVPLHFTRLPPRLQDDRPAADAARHADPGARASRWPTGCATSTPATCTTAKAAPPSARAAASRVIERDWYEHRRRYDLDRRTAAARSAAPPSPAASAVRRASSAATGFRFASTSPPEGGLPMGEASISIPAGGDLRLEGTLAQAARPRPRPVRTLRASTNTAAEQSGRRSLTAMVTAQRPLRGFRSAVLGDASSVPPQVLGARRPGGLNSASVRGRDRLSDVPASVPHSRISITSSSSTWPKSR